LAAPALRRFVLSILPEEHRDYADETFHEIGQTMGGYVRGSVIQGLIIGVLAWVGLSIIGVDYPLVLAIIAGFGELIPVLGPIIAFVPIVGISLLDGFTTTIIAVVFWIAIQQFENHILTPGIMHSQTQMSPLLVIFAVFLGGQAGGIVGALVAIPLAGAVKIVVVRVLAPWIRRWAGISPPDEDQSEAAI
jgi:predicted PurR-regulated permease PerM